MEREKSISVFLSILLLMCLSMHTEAQEKKEKMVTIKGQVVDFKTKASIPYASVGIGVWPAISISKQVAPADKDGFFSFKILPGTKFSIIITHIGYNKYVNLQEPITDTDKVTDIGKMELRESDVKLDEVIVKPLVSVTASEVVYNLDQDPDREHMNLHDILDKVPMVDRTPDGKLYIEDPRKSFLVIRNGKKDVLFKEGNIDEVLKAIPAKSFQTVKIQLVPEKRFGEYAYVMDIEADKTNALFGIINLNNDSYNTSSGTLDINSEILGSYDRLRFSAGGGFKNINAPDVETTREQNFHTDNLNISQTGKKEKNGETFTGQAAFSYDIATRQFISGYINYNNARTRNKELLQIEENRPQKYMAYGSTAPAFSKTYGIKGEINYQYDFKKKGRILNVLYNALYQPRENNSYTNLWGDFTENMLVPSQKGDQRTNQHTVQAHYTDRIGKAVTLETGVSYLYRDEATNTRYTDQNGNEVTADRYDMESEKNMIRGYLNLGYNTKNFTAQIGLNGEYLDDGKGTRILRGKDTPEYISEKGLILTPDANLSLLFPKKFISRVGIGYMWRQTRPSIRMMSTHTDYSNPNFITVGNPELKNSNSHRFTLTISPQKGPSINMYARYATDSPESYWYNDSQGRVIQTYANYGKEYSYGANTRYQWYLFKRKLHLSLSGGCEYRREEMSKNETSESLITQLTMYTSFQLGRIGSLNMDIYYYDDNGKGMSRVERKPITVALGGRFKLFKDRLEIGARIEDLFNFKSKTEWYVDMDDFNTVNAIRSNAFPFRITATWRIGDFKVKPIKHAKKRAVFDDRAAEE